MPGLLTPNTKSRRSLGHFKGGWVPSREAGIVPGWLTLRPASTTSDCRIKEWWWRSHGELFQSLAGLRLLVKWQLVISFQNRLTNGCISESTVCPSASTSSGATVWSSIHQWRLKSSRLRGAPGESFVRAAMYWAQGSSTKYMISYSACYHNFFSCPSSNCFFVAVNVQADTFPMTLDNKGIWWAWAIRVLSFIIFALISFDD
jgi:hypothetical protein